MKITKFVHSCLLVEEDGVAALFDPGEFSVQLLRQIDLPQISHLFITHEHFDHLDLDYIKELMQQHPNMQIMTTSAAKSILEEAEISGVTEISSAERFSAPHEGHAPFIAPPEATGIHYLSQLSHPGDSHSFTETMPILALPVTAPWGSTDRAVQLALELKPQQIIPIHDWHWKDEVRIQIYDRLEKIFTNEGIIFHKAVDGEPITIELGEQ